MVAPISLEGFLKSRPLVFLDTSEHNDLVVKFYGLLTSYPHLTWVPLTLNVADHAARLRAEHRLKTPDSIQAASAIAAGATGFICNDKIFKKVKEFVSLVINKYA